MRLLFATPERDLLTAYKRLLETGDCTVSTAFDGTQVLTAVAKEHPDAVVLDEALPRIDIRHLLTVCREEDIPVIELTRREVDLKMLIREPAPSDYLPFPFEPSELRERIAAVLRRRKEGRSLQEKGLCIDEKAFRLNGLSVTEQELAFLERLPRQAAEDAARESVCVGAIQWKLEKTGSPGRIRYVSGEGYQMVKSHE